MQSCLGLYIEDKLIKYAKISKERNNVKVEAYGVKFYDSNLDKTIEQIVEETFSYQIPISVNLGREQYAYSNVFSLLQPKDLEKAIETEFEVFCNTNNKNKNTLEFRRIKASNLEDRDKTRVVYTYVDKTNIVERLQLLDNYKVRNISPIATTLPNLNKAAIQQNCVIVNLEQKTELITLVNGKVYKVDEIEDGIGKILHTIEESENSFTKAYEICKNTTVYTKSSQNLRIEGNEYLDEIVMILFDLIDKIKQTIINNSIDIDSIYLTGTGIIINNLDLLFQENFIEKKCEILIPSFVEKTNVKINIKDYLEVNSAIALALQCLEPPKNIENNFNVRNSLSDNVKKVFSTAGRGEGGKGKKRITAKEFFHAELDNVDKALIRLIVVLFIAIIAYIVVAHILKSNIDDKTDEAQATINDSTNKIAQVDGYRALIDARSSEYQKLIERIDEQNEKVSENLLRKNAIPNMLNKIMYVIPTGVQLLSIEHVEKRITITAQADKYDQLGYFKAALEEEGILTNITTTKGVKTGDMINITITGELPY